MPSLLSETAATMLKGLIVVDPKGRFTVQDVITHSWLEGVTNRAELVYGPPPPMYPPDSGMPDGARPIPDDAVTKEQLRRVTEFGFPATYVEESLKDGRLNHATAAYQLLIQQSTRTRAAATALTTCAMDTSLNGDLKESPPHGDLESESPRHEDSAT